MSKMYVTGDTHRFIDIDKFERDRFPEQSNLTKDDFVIVVGDWGGIWYGSDDDDDKIVQDWYDKKSWTTLFIDGNHENHDALDKYPVAEWHGGKVHFISDSIIHLMRGQVYTINGKKFFTMGGAESHDKLWRKEGISWWAREMPSDDEYEEGFANLEKNGNKVDYILTHCAPDVVVNIVGRKAYKHDKLSNYLEVIRATVEFDKWYFGHYHFDYSWKNGKYNCLYDRIELL